MPRNRDDRAIPPTPNSPAPHPLAPSAWGSSTAASLTPAQFEEPSEQGFPMIVLPALLAGNRCARGETPFSSSCLVAYIAGGRAICPSCDEAIPRLLQAILAVGLDRTLAAAIPKYLATAQSRSLFYR